MCRFSSGSFPAGSPLPRPVHGAHTHLFGGRLPSPLIRASQTRAVCLPHTTCLSWPSDSCCRPTARVCVCPSPWQSCCELGVPGPRWDSLGLGHRCFVQQEAGASGRPTLTPKCSGTFKVRQGIPCPGGDGNWRRPVPEAWTGARSHGPRSGVQDGQRLSRQQRCGAGPRALMVGGGGRRALALASQWPLWTQVNLS